jgi:DNA-binding transcriptional LysR family regulator
MDVPQREVEARVRGVRLHQLEGFFHVATQGGFARAASAMPYPITEPALHQQVRKLERALATSLLVRGPGRRMVTTAEGRALLAFVTPYFEGLPRALRALAGGAGGEVAVGAEPLLVEGLCAEALADLRAKAPGCRARLIEAEVPDLVRMLSRGEVDVAVAGLLGAPAGIDYERIGCLGLELLVPPGHPVAARKASALRPGDLVGHDVIVYAKGSFGRAFTEQALARAGVPLSVAAEASSAAAMKALVRAGVAPAFVPSLSRPRTRRRTLRDGVIAFDLTGAVGEDELPAFGLLTRTGAPPAGLAARFVELARARARRKP